MTVLSSFEKGQAQEPEKFRLKHKFFYGLKGSMLIPPEFKVNLKILKPQTSPELDELYLSTTAKQIALALNLAQSLTTSTL